MQVAASFPKLSHALMTCSVTELKNKGADRKISNNMRFKKAKDHLNLTEHVKRHVLYFSGCGKTESGQTNKNKNTRTTEDEEKQVH